MSHKKKKKAGTGVLMFLIIVLFLGISAAGFYFARNAASNYKQQQLEEQALQFAAEQAEAEAEHIAIEAAVSTPEPTPQPTPTPVPTATPQPTPTPVPVESYGKVIGSGSAQSHENGMLTLNTEWSAKTLSSTMVEVTVNMTLTSYSLVTVGRPLNVKLGDETRNEKSPYIRIETGGQQTTEMGSCTFTLPLSSGEAIQLPLSVVWEAEIEYGNAFITALYCDCDVSLSR